MVRATDAIFARKRFIPTVRIDSLALAMKEASWFEIGFAE
jgi:hypothetical protein